jgi:hypothetical protein
VRKRNKVSLSFSSGVISLVALRGRGRGWSLLPWGGESLIVYVCCRFGVRIFR